MHTWSLMHDPLLVDNLPKLAEYIREEWPSSGNGIVSNLSMLSSRSISALWQAGIRKIQFSFYGIAEVHDVFAGRVGAYENLQRAIPMLQDKGFELKPVIWLHRSIGPSLPRLMDIWRRYSFDLRDGRLPAASFTPLGWNPGAADELPRVEDISAYRSLLPEDVFEHGEGDICTKVINEPDARNEDTAVQREFSLAYTVLPNGDVYEFWVPPHKDFLLGNVFRDGIDAIHERYYSNDYLGEKNLSAVSDKQAVIEMGNTSSTRLYTNRDSLLSCYKLKKCGYL